MNKVPVAEGGIGGSKDARLIARVDLKAGMELPSDIALGSEIEMVVKGTVVGLRAAEMNRYKDEKGKNRDSYYPGELRLEITNVCFDCCGQFDGMSEDD